MLSSDIYHIGRRQLSISCEGTAENLRTDNGTTCLRLFLFNLLDRCITIIRTGNGFKDSWREASADPIDVGPDSEGFG